jgi:hypothetical protein
MSGLGLIYLFVKVVEMHTYWKRVIAIINIMCGRWLVHTPALLRRVHAVFVSLACLHLLGLPHFIPPGQHAFFGQLLAAFAEATAKCASKILLPSAGASLYFVFE